MTLAPLHTWAFWGISGECAVFQDYSTVTGGDILKAVGCRLFANCTIHMKRSHVRFLNLALVKQFAVLSCVSTVKLEIQRRDDNEALASWA